MSQLELFKKDQAKIPRSVLRDKMINISIDEIQPDDRLFYKIGRRTYYGAVLVILENHKFFIVEDLGVSKTISRDHIVEKSPHRWI